MSKSARRVGKKLLISLVSLAAVLVVLELGSRAAGYGPSDDHPRWMAHPELQAILLPSQELEFGHDDPETGERRLPLRINRYSQRGPDYPLAKPADELRIIVVGDSLTFGPGVLDHQAYPAVLRDLYESEPHNGKRPYVVNAGVNGWASWHYLRWAETQLEKFQPDVLVVGLYLGNDMVLSAGFRETIPVPFEDTLRSSAFYRLLVQKYRTYLWRRVAAARRGMPIEDLDEQLQQYMGLIESKLSPEEQRHLWEKNSIPHLVRIAEACRARGVELVVLVIPSYPMLVFDAEHPTHRFIRGRLVALGIPTVTCLEELRRSHTPIWLPYDKGHFNVDGHGILARTLGRGLQRLGLVP